MEINISRFFHNADAYEYSGSIMERGNDAAKETFANAMAKAGELEPALLATPRALDEFRSHMVSMGFEYEKVEAWSDADCNAVFIQLISGDIREADLDTSDPDWDEYEANDNKAGALFKGDDDEIYYYLGD